MQHKEPISWIQNKFSTLSLKETGIYSKVLGSAHKVYFPTAMTSGSTNPVLLMLHVFKESKSKAQGHAVA
jgi:lipopolysaccharide export system protein LptC